GNHCGNTVEVNLWNAIRKYINAITENTDSNSGVDGYHTRRSVRCRPRLNHHAVVSRLHQNELTYGLEVVGEAVKGDEMGIAPALRWRARGDGSCGRPAVPRSRSRCRATSLSA